MAAPKDLRSLIGVLGDLALVRPWLVLRRGNEYMSLLYLMSKARRDVAKGPEESRRALSTPAYWWDDDPEGLTVIWRMTSEGPEVWVAEPDSRLVPP